MYAKTFILDAINRLTALVKIYIAKYLCLLQFIVTLAHTVYMEMINIPLRVHLFALIIF